MHYITYREAERLFEAWPLIKQTKQSMSTGLRIIERAKNDKESIDEWIYSLSVGNKVLDGLPHQQTGTSSTERVATNYDNIISKEILSSKDEVKAEIILLYLVDEKLKIAFDSLTERQKEILTMFYWEKNTWDEILNQIAGKKGYLSKRQAQIQREDAIRKIYIISRITQKVYTDVMKIIDKGERR